MASEISSTLLNRLRKDAAESPDREICGLLFGTPERIDAGTPCRNVALNPCDAFEIDPAQLIAAHRAERDGGARIVGCYHSHPAGRAVPSSRDAAAAAPDGSLWLIVAGGTVGCYRATSMGCFHGRFEPVDLRIFEDTSIALPRPRS